MGRYFQTTRADIANDYMFEPDWNIISAGVQQRQQEYDNTLANLELLKNSTLQVQHLNGEEDLKNLQIIQDYYGSNIDKIAEEIRKNGEVGKYMKDIRALGAELKEDLRTGELSKIQGSAVALANWQKENAEIKKKDPAYYAKAERAFLENYHKNGGNSLYKPFSGQLLYNKPDFEKIIAQADKVIANETGWVKDSISGQWVTKTGQKVSQVEYGRVQARVMGALLADPSNLQYMKQAQEIGFTRYFDENGQLDYTSPGLIGLDWVAKATARKSQENTHDVSANPFGLNEQKHQHNIALKNHENKLKKDDSLLRIGEKAIEKGLSAIANGDEKLAERFFGIGASYIHPNATMGIITAGFHGGDDIFSEIKDSEKNPSYGKYIDTKIEEYLNDSSLSMKDKKTFRRDILPKIRKGEIHLENIDNYLIKMGLSEKDFSSWWAYDPHGEMGNTKEGVKAHTPLSNFIKGIQEKFRKERELIRATVEYTQGVVLNPTQSSVVTPELKNILNKNTSGFNITDSENNLLGNNSDIPEPRQVLAIGNKHGGIQFSFVGEDGKIYSGRSNNKLSFQQNAILQNISNLIGNKTEVGLLLQNPFAASISGSISAANAIGQPQISIPISEGKFVKGIISGSNISIELNNGTVTNPLSPIEASDFINNNISIINIK